MESISSDITEYGLLLPNGQVLWNNYSNHSLETPADRQTMVQVLQKTAEECGFPEEQFTSCYRWVCRRVETTVTDLGVFALCDSAVVGLDTSSVIEDDGNYDNDNDIAEASGAIDNSSNSDSGDLR